MKLERVLSVRMSNRTILGLVDLMTLYKQSGTTGMSSAVRRICEVIVETERTKERIPDYTEEEAFLLLNDMFASGPGRPIDTSKYMPAAAKPLTNEDFAPMTSLEEAIEPPEKTLTEFQMSAALEEVLLAEIRAQELRDEEEFLQKILITKPIPNYMPTPNEPAKVDIDKQPMLSIEAISGTEAYQKLKMDPLSITAVRVIYKGIPESLWDTEKVYSLIEKWLKDMRKQRGMEE